jgi:hypothetical protein
LQVASSIIFITPEHHLIIRERERQIDSLSSLEHKVVVVSSKIIHWIYKRKGKINVIREALV